jgi:hypothetical protein
MSDRPHSSGDAGKTARQKSTGAPDHRGAPASSLNLRHPTGRDPRSYSFDRFASNSRDRS